MKQFPIQKHIANQITHMLKNQNMSLRQLSEQSGVSLAHLSKILNCKVNPTIVILQQLSSAFNVHMTCFFEDIPYPDSMVTPVQPLAEELYVGILSIHDKRLIHIHDAKNKSYGYLELPSNIRLSETVHTSLNKIKNAIDSLLKKK